MKNYIGFVNDHSGSMQPIAQAAMKDYNNQIEAVKHAATTEMMDTVVSVVGVGVGNTGDETERQVTISNPHVLKPITHWPTNGGTPLYDGIGNMIELLSGLPDADNPNVSFLVMITTDGEERHSKTKWQDDLYLKSELARLQRNGRWTFVFRVPRGARAQVADLGVPAGNIQEWDTTAKGMEESSKVATQAMTNFYSTRSAGGKATGGFFSDAANVNLAQLEDISSKVKLYQVPNEDIYDGIQIRDFILGHVGLMQYLKGAAFYQLVKTEARVSYTKQVLIRERTTGKVFGGAEARKQIGLPSDRNARLHPGDHANYDIFIQSESINRKLPKGTGVLYWKELGTEFTQEEIDRFTKPADPKRVPAVAPVVVLPAVHNTSGKPVHSTMPVNKKIVYFASRADARRSGKKFKDNGPTVDKAKRWEQV